MIVIPISDKMSIYLLYKYRYMIFTDYIILPVALSYGTTYFSFNQPRVIAVIELMCAFTLAESPMNTRSLANILLSLRNSLFYF